MFKNFKKVSLALLLAIFISAASTNVLPAFAEIEDTIEINDETSITTEVNDPGEPPLKGALLITFGDVPQAIWRGSGDLSLRYSFASYTDRDHHGALNKLTCYTQEVDHSNYSVTEVYDGNGIMVTFKEDFLKTLPDGDYYIIADFEKVDVIPIFYFAVNTQTDTATSIPNIDSSPKTGDDTLVALAFILLSAVSGAVALAIKRRDI